MAPNPSPPIPAELPRFPPGLGHAYLFSTFNALSFQIIVGSPMVLYAKDLGAGATILGLLAGMLPLLVLLQIPAASHVERVGYRRFVYTGWGTRVGIIFGIALVPLLGAFLNSTSRLALLVLLLFGFNVSRGISSAGWLPWITQLVPAEVRGRYLAREAVCVQLASCATLGIAAGLLSGNPSPWRFAALFAFSGAMGLVSLSFLARIPDVLPPPRELTSREPVPWRALARPPAFRRLFAVSAAWSVAWGGINVFTVAFLRTEAGWAEGPILAVTALSFAGGLAALIYFEPRIDRLGSKPVLLFWLIIWVFLLVAWLTLSLGRVAPRFSTVLVLQLVMGAAFALCSMNLTRLAMQLAPSMGRSHFFALYSVVANLTLGLSPIAWGLLIDAWGPRRPAWLGGDWHRYSVYFAGALLAFVVAAALGRRLEEPKARPTSELVREILTTPHRFWLRLWPRA